MGSTHHLTERNLWVKFNENHSKGSGDMERTRNSRVNPMNLKCDLESGWLESLTLHIVSLRLTFDQSLMKIFQKVLEIWSGHEIQR